MEKKLISYIKKSHLKAVQRFNEELKAFAKETGEEVATLYEDANTSFTLSDISISQDGQLFYTYDGQVESVRHCLVTALFLLANKKTYLTTNRHAEYSATP